MKSYRLTLRFGDCHPTSLRPTLGNQATQQFMRHFNASDVHLCSLVSQRAHEEMADYKCH